jgi:surface polysaccharide O-acyltransferase-like enzyme
MFAPDKIQDANTGNRICWLDNLRTFMVFLVVFIHAGGVYERRGTWALFWIVDDPATNHLSGILFLILDIFVMSTIFFISGFFGPLSIRNKDGRTFLRSKLKRLMLPWIIAVLCLIPIYKMIFLYSRNIPQESWTSYFHWNAMWSQNWLWFLPVLFLFNVLYMLLTRVKCLPEKTPIKSVIGAMFVLGFVNSFGMDMLKLRGWTKTLLLDFQNERLLIYFMMFLLGALCYRQKVFTEKPRGRKLYLAVCASAWIPVAVYIFALLMPVSKPGSFVISALADRGILWLAFHLSLLCLLYLLIESFRRYVDRPGRLLKELSRNSYALYIIHVIMLGLIALPLLNVTIPSFLKHLVLTVSTCVVSNLMIHLYRRTIKSKLFIQKMEESTMKVVTTTTLLVILISLAGCTKQEDADKEKTPPHVNLHVAALQGNLDAIQQHVDAGSNLNERDAYGSSALIIAATFGRTDVAEALIHAGADMTTTNNEGATPLHIAAFFCRTEIVRALLEKGADRTLKNKAGHTALETVAVPFDSVKGVYDSIGKGLKPLGLRLNYERIKTTRPRIAEMLR